MSPVDQAAENTIRLRRNVTEENQRKLSDDVNSLIERGATRIHVDCSDLSTLTGEHIWLLLHIQTQCDTQGITVILTTPTSTLFNIDTLGSLIEASSSLSKRAAPPEAPASAAPVPEDQPNRLVQKIRARSSELALSTREFESFLDQFQLDKVDRYTIRTIYTEAVQNIYRHAGLRDTQEIQVQAEFTGRCFGLTFVDEGVEFDPTADTSFREHVSDPSAVEFPHFGIKMLRHLADDMTYQRNQLGKNVLRIIKELQQ